MSKDTIDMIMMNFTLEMDKTYREFLTGLPYKRHMLDLLKAEREFMEYVNNYCDMHFKYDLEYADKLNRKKYEEVFDNEN